jgi:hypothetical protein
MPMRAIHFVLGGCAAICLLAITACGPGPVRAAPAAAVARPAAVVCANRAGFALSLVSDRGGRAKPAAAAVWFARHGGVAGVPHEGWRQVGRARHSATVASGSYTLHAIQGPDRTWQVDSGSHCS